MSKKISYLKYRLLSKITTGKTKEHYTQKKKELKQKLSYKKSERLEAVIRRLEYYQAYYKFYLLFKQHYNITIPADVCGTGNCFSLIRIKLKDIKRRWDNQTYSLKECSPYRYLVSRDKKVYQKYVQKHIDRCLTPENTTWDVQQFIDLEKSISKNGYNPEHSVIVVDQNNFIMDGQHRSCILLYKYGGDYEITAVQVIQQ